MDAAKVREILHRFADELADAIVAEAPEPRRKRNTRRMPAPLPPMPDVTPDVLARVAGQLRKHGV